MNEQFTLESISFTVNDDGTITATNSHPAEKYSWAVHDLNGEKTYFHSKWSERNIFTFPKITKDSIYLLKAFVSGIRGSRQFFKFAVRNGEMYYNNNNNEIQFPYEHEYDDSILNQETLISAGYNIPVNELSYLDNAEFIDINAEFESIFERHGLDKYLLSNRVYEALEKYANKLNKAYDSCNGTVGLCCSKRLYCTFLYLELLSFVPEFLITAEIPTLSYYLEDELAESNTKVFTINDYIQKNKNVDNIIVINDETSTSVDEVKVLFKKTSHVINIEPANGDDFILIRYFGLYYKHGLFILSNQLNKDLYSLYVMDFLGLLASSRDFVNLKSYVSFVVFHKIVKWKQWLAAWLETQILIEKIKLLITRRENVNHILLFQDALRYCGAKKMGFKQFDNLTVGLDNYYAFAGWTRQSFYSIVKGASYFQYPRNSKNKLLETVDKYGFDMINVAEDNRSGGLITKESKTKKPTNLFPLEGHISQECWKILAQMCLTKTNSVIFAHSVAEVHSGASSFEFNKHKMLSERYKDFKNGIAAESDAVAAYKDFANSRAANLSKQLDYYLPIMTINPNNKLVLTADHGQVPRWFFILETKIPFYNYYQQESYHIPFYLFNYDDKFKALKDVMLSHIDFHETLEALISGDINPLLEGNEYVRHEELPVYDYSQIFIAGKTDEQIRRTNFCGAVSITTRTDKYMFLADGRESYFILPYDYRPEYDLIEESRYWERIFYLRSLVERDFWDKFWNEHTEYGYCKEYFLGKK
jgi:hypothetical protein